ncbi:MAG: tetratricopeptide repeat protein [Cyanobacteria bacterium P01_A01_bin.83]
MIYRFFSIPCARKFQRIKKLIDLESFEAAYNLIEQIFQNQYAVLVGYPETLLPYRAFCLLNLSRYQEAIVVYDLLITKIEQAPGTNNKAFRQYLSQLLFYKSCALVRLEEFQRAIVCLDRAIKYQSDNPHIWHQKACALSAIEDYHNATVACDRALQYEPENYDVCLVKALSLYDLKDYQNATAICDFILQNQPNNHLAWMQKAMIADRSKDYYTAIAYYDRVLEIQPDDYDYYIIYDKARCHALLAEIDLAIDNIERFIHLFPEFNREDFNNDQDFNNLKQDPRFQALLK